eukprot:138798_1
MASSLLLRRLASRTRPIVSSMSWRAMSTKPVIPQVPDSVMAGEDKSLNRMERTESIYKLGKHRSNGLELIQKVPIIEVEGDVAVCDGGGGALGHPLEYIKVGHRNG